MNNPPRIFIRSSAFLRKEIVEIIRQPLLVLTLVLGPFLILLFFGIGYRNEARSLRTMFVVEENPELAQKIEQYASRLGKQLVFIGLTDDIESAQESLRQGEIDLITVVPSDAYETIYNNQQAVLLLYHHEIDPFQTDYINVFGRVYVDEVNRRILRFITSAGQVDVSKAQERLDTARASARALRRLLEDCAEALAQPEAAGGCDSQAARAYLRELDRNVDEVDLAMGDSLSLSEAVEQALGDANGGETDHRTSASLDNIIQNTNELEVLGETADDYITQLEILAQLETDLEAVKARLATFLDIDPRVLISPFRSEAKSIATVVPDIADYFAPSVVVLLLQHLAVTFAALSMVREHQLGSMELFYVSPLSALEALVGKYLSYLIFGGVLAAILFALVVFGLGAPMLGHWASVGAITLTLLFTSLGIGFLISLVSNTDIQAVQYSMIVLLTSVFFSGFFLGLETLWEPVRFISWSLPATYAILLLRDVMLRGDPLELALLLQLLVFGVALFVGAWILLRRSMVHG
jgi:ABC-2 type transport system permease protein